MDHGNECERVRQTELQAKPHEEKTWTLEMGLGDGNVYNSATEEDLRKVITYHPYYPRVGPMRDFPGGSDGKESSCNVGDLGSQPLGWSVLPYLKW